MESGVVVVVDVLFDVGEVSCEVFCFVGAEPAFDFAVRLWSVNACKHVFYAERLQSDSVLAVVPSFLVAL